MGDYVEAMAYSLAAYDHHKQNKEYYEAICWSGLESTDAYKSFSTSKKDKIQKIIKNERYAKKDAKGEKCD